jgi:hypothetical protein
MVPMKISTYDKMVASKLEIPDTYTFVIAAAVGLALGAILSLLFGRLALPTRVPFEFTIAGMSTGVLLTNLLIVVIIGAIVFFGYVSMVVQDTAFPRVHPWLFFIETMVVGFVPASVIYVMQDFRDDGVLDLSKLNREFLLLAGKFAIFHLLFQFSGVYSYFFGAT